MKINKKIKSILAGTWLATSLLVSAPGFSANYGLMEDVLLMAQVSNLGYTRINMEDEKITDVFVYPEESAKVVLHNLGTVFVLQELKAEHVYLTLVGESGTIQDMRLKFSSIQPEPIKLIRSVSSRNVTRENSQQNSSAQKDIKQTNNLTTKTGK
jgi:hypothetical protein